MKSLVEQFGKTTAFRPLSDFDLFEIGAIR